MCHVLMEALYIMNWYFNLFSGLVAMSIARLTYEKERRTYFKLSSALIPYEHIFLSYISYHFLMTHLDSCIS